MLKILEKIINKIGGNKSVLHHEEQKIVRNYNGVRPSVHDDRDMIWEVMRLLETDEHLHEEYIDNVDYRVKVNKIYEEQRKFNIAYANYVNAYAEAKDANRKLLNKIDEIECKNN